MPGAAAPALGRRLAPLGLVVAAAGYLGPGPDHRRRHLDDAETLPLLSLAGAGFGAGYSQVITRSIATSPRRRPTSAAASFNTINMLGFALGVATLGSVFLSAVGAPTAAETGSAFELVALACGALRWSRRSGRWPCGRAGARRGRGRQGAATRAAAAAARRCRPARASHGTMAP